eukprot:g16425.t1
MRDRSRCKTVILIRKNTGYDFFLKLLRNMCGALFGIATLDQKAEFNCRRTNLRGEQFRVLVAEALEAGEGCSFLNVREHHAGLPPGERTVQVRLICSSLPEGLGNNFLGSYFWRSATRSTTTLPPAGWQKILDKARRAADCAEKHLDLDPADADCLADMRANLEDWLSKQCVAEPHSSVQKVKKTFAKLRFDRSVSQITHACAKRLAVETIDQKACRVLAKRCRLDGVFNFVCSHFLLVAVVLGSVVFGVSLEVLKVIEELSDAILRRADERLGDLCRNICRQVTVELEIAAASLVRKVQENEPIHDSAVTWPTWPNAASRRAPTMAWAEPVQKTTSEYEPRLVDYPLPLSTSRALLELQDEGAELPTIASPGSHAPTKCQVAPSSEGAQEDKDGEGARRSCPRSCPTRSCDRVTASSQ